MNRPQVVHPYGVADDVRRKQMPKVAVYRTRFLGHTFTLRGMA